MPVIQQAPPRAGLSDLDETPLLIEGQAGEADHLCEVRHAHGRIRQQAMHRNCRVVERIAMR